MDMLQKLGVNADAEAMYRESQRAMMVETYKQSAALTVCVGLTADAARAAREGEAPFDPAKIAEQAVAVADALAAKVFDKQKE